MMASEDFSFMLERVPGAYIFIGNGDSTGLHTTTYDFNDGILERGALLFRGLARSHLAKAVSHKAGHPFWHGSALLKREALMRRHELSNEEWATIAPSSPTGCSTCLRPSNCS